MKLLQKNPDKAFILLFWGHIYIGNLCRKPSDPHLFHPFYRLKTSPFCVTPLRKFPRSHTTKHNLLYLMLFCSHHQMIFRAAYHPYPVPHCILATLAEPNHVCFYFLNRIQPYTYLSSPNRGTCMYFEISRLIFLPPFPEWYTKAPPSPSILVLAYPTPILVCLPLTSTSPSPNFGSPQ